MSAAPLSLHTGRVLPEWIDYNGHMNVAYYVLAFDHASDRLFDHFDLGETYRRATDHSIFVLEAHVTYERELKAGDPLAVTTQLIDADAKRLHFFHRMLHGAEGYLAATIELMTLHVNLRGPKAAPIPAAAAEKIQQVLAAHRLLPPPPQLGHRIGLASRRA